MLIGVQIFFIVLALITSFTILVWWGIGHAPKWAIYASFPIMALGGGAAINLILNGVPK